MDASTLPDVEESALWQRLRTAADADAREQILALHLPYAKVVAASYYGRRFHDEIGFEDYHQLAALGMIEAVDRFDPSRGVQFRTFAARRMHGAILNGLERLTEKQQQIAARQRLRCERLHEVKAAAGGAPPASSEQLLRYVSDVGIGLALCWMLEGTAMVDLPEASANAPFYQSVAVRQLRERLLFAVEALPPQERAVVRGHYLQDMQFEEIATMLRLTKGRISQIHKQALLRLRNQVRDHAEWNLTL